ncbi:hypothetical protein D3C86_1895400 [compost metagenome]
MLAHGRLDIQRVDGKFAHRLADDGVGLLGKRHPLRRIYDPRRYALLIQQQFEGTEIRLHMRIAAHRLGQFFELALLQLLAKLLEQ